MNKKDAQQFKKILMQRRTEILNKVSANKERETEVVIGDEIDTASPNQGQQKAKELKLNL